MEQVILAFIYCLPSNIGSKSRQLPVRRTTCLFIMILPCVTISYQCSIAMLLEATQQHPPTLGAFGSILHLFTKPQLRRLLDRLVVEHVGMAVVGVGIPGGTPHGRVPRTSEVSQNAERRAAWGLGSHVAGDKFGCPDTARVKNGKGYFGVTRIAKKIGSILTQGTTWYNHHCCSVGC